MRPFSTMKKRRAVAQFNRGYDWAAGVLLRGEMSAIEVESYYLSQNRSEFDLGAQEATNRLCACKIVEDDRI